MYTIVYYWSRKDQSGWGTTQTKKISKTYLSEVENLKKSFNYETIHIVNIFPPNLHNI